MYTQVSDDAQLEKNSRDPLRMLYVHLGSYTSVNLIYKLILLGRNKSGHTMSKQPTRLS